MASHQISLVLLEKKVGVHLRGLWRKKNWRKLLVLYFFITSHSETPIHLLCDAPGLEQTWRTSSGVIAILSRYGDRSRHSAHFRALPARGTCMWRETIILTYLKKKSLGDYFSVIIGRRPRHGTHYNARVSNFVEGAGSFLLNVSNGGRWLKPGLFHVSRIVLRG